LGFSFIEVGSVTPEPQLGNPGERVFRLIEDEAVINRLALFVIVLFEDRFSTHVFHRYGFNSYGHEIVKKNIEELRKDKSKNFIIGINLGKNKLSQDAIGDYVKGVKLFCDLADYLVVNISR